MASIKALKNKEGKITSYKITVSDGYDHGRKIVKSTTYRPTATAPTKILKEVEDYARDFEKAVLNGTACLSGDQIRFKDFVKVWEEELDYKVVCKKITVRSKEDYIKIMNNHVIPYLGDMRLTQIKAPHIKSMLKNLLLGNKSPNTVRNIFNTLHACLDYAFDNEYIPVNPCAKCKKDLPKVERDTDLHIFNEDQVQRFLFEALTKEYDVNIGGRNHNTEKRSVSLQHRVYFTLALYSGCRRGELIALNWEDVDPVNKKIKISKAISRSDKEGLHLKDPKTKAGKRTIPLPGICFDLLKEWKEEQQNICDILGSAWEGYRGKNYDKNPVFIQSDSGKRMHVETPSHKFKQILEAYNNSVSEDKQLPIIRLHDLRHTEISHLFAAGLDPIRIASRSGHSRPSISEDIYAHTVDENDRTASDVLEELFSLAI